PLVAPRPLPCCRAAKACEEMLPCRLEFRPHETEAKKKRPKVVLRGGGVEDASRAHSSLRVARRRDKREAKLRVRLDLLGVIRSLEVAELGRALREEGVEVDACVTRLALPRRALVPDSAKLLPRARPSRLQAPKEVLADRSAVAVEAALLDAKGMLDEPL